MEGHGEWRDGVRVSCSAPFWESLQSLFHSLFRQGSAMSSKIKLIYTHRQTGAEIQVRRVSTTDYIDTETGARISSYALRKDYRLDKKNSQMVNRRFTITSKRPTISPDLIGKFNVRKGRERKICDTGKGPTMKLPYEVYWGDEFVAGDFPRQHDALLFIKQKAES
jgi:hypothetical protein